MKRWLVIASIGAVVTVAVFLFFSRLEQKATVVVAAADLPAGAVIRPTDIELRTLHASGAVTGAYTDTAQVLGQTLTVPRLAGDQFTPAAFAYQPSESEGLGAGERAIALRVSDSQGVLGVLQPGDRVSAVMVDSRNNQARLLLTSLRVLRVSYDFRYTEPEQRSTAPSGPISLSGNDAETESASYTATASSTAQRSQQGVVLLAVPNTLIETTWQFPTAEGEVFTGTLKLAPTEVLALMDKLGGIHLVLEPENAQAQEPSTGVNLTWLFPTPTPTPAPEEPPAGATTPLTATGVITP